MGMMPGTKEDGSKHTYCYSSRRWSRPYSFFVVGIVWGFLFVAVAMPVTNALAVDRFNFFDHLLLFVPFGVFFMLPLWVLSTLFIPKEIVTSDSHLIGKRQFWGTVNIPWGQIAKTSKERGSFGHEWVWLITSQPWLSGRYLLFSSEISDYADLVRRIEEAKGGP